MQRLHEYRMGRGWLIAQLFLAAGGWLSVGNWACAQEPTEAELKAQDPAAQPDDSQFRNAADVKKLLRDGQPLDAADKAKFDAHFNEYVLLLLKSAKQQEDLPKFRKNFRSYFLNGKKGGPPYDRLNGLTRSMMKKYIAGEFPPAVRSNAALILGELNADEGSSSVPPTPLVAAQKDLIALLGDAKTDDAVRATALIGLQRFAESHRRKPIEAPLLAALIDAVLPIATASVPPEGRSAAGHDWLRSDAIGVLRSLKEVGPNQSVLKALSAVVADKQSSAKTRAAAARALGSLNFGGVKPDVRPWAASLETILADACKSELERADARNQSPEKRRLWGYLVDAKLAIDGLSPVDESKALAAVDARVKSLSKHIEKDDWEQLRQEVEKIK